MTINRKKKKKLSLKKIKKILLNIWNSFIDFIKNTYRNFMSLPKHVLQVICVWGIVVLIIIIIIIVGAVNGNFLKKYATMESEMNSATLKYLEEYGIYPLSENKLKTDLNVLLEEGMLYKSDVVDDSCRGFSISYYNDEKEEYIVNSYVSCDGYTTKGFLDYK